jgi:integrase/recombinase XerD
MIYPTRQNYHMHRKNHAKRDIARWLDEPHKCHQICNELFLTKNGTRLSNRAVQDMIKKYIVISDIQRHGIMAHKLRQTSATLMYCYGGVNTKSLKSILRQLVISTTSIYLHSDNCYCRILSM